MQPLLDELALPQVQEITTRDSRALAEHKPPGMEGSLFQNLGRRPTEVILRGVASGPDSLTFVESLDARFRAGDPLPFIADIVADSQIEQMLIDDLSIEERAGKPQRYEYVLRLKSHIEPVEPDDASLLDSGILEDAQQLVGNLVTGLEILERLSAFIGRLSELNEGLKREGLNSLPQPPQPDSRR